MNFDMIIQQGTVIDGTGAAGILADVGIRDGKIAAIGHLEGAFAEKRIEAAGKIVAPGFIDVHVHSELALLGGRDRYAPLKMGVTTQLAGPDGFSWAPLSGRRFREMKDAWHVFYEDESSLGERSELTISQYLDLFRGRLPSNLVLQAPHGAIRCAVLGWADRVATEDELMQMEALTSQWMEAGARSFCTGLEYEPMRRADTNELIRLAKIARQYGAIYVAHQRGYADKVREGCRETFLIGKEADIPVHISHFAMNETGEQLIDEALREGVQVTFDMYPYPAGCTHLLMGLPEWLQQGPPETILEKLQKRSVREAMKDHLAQAFPLDRVVFAAVGSEQPTGWEGKSLGEVQQLLGMPLEDAVAHILLETKLQALMIYHWPQERVGELERTFQHAVHMVSTDGVYVGDKPHPRGFGTYPRVLGEFVRKNGWLTLEQAIYKMTGLPAQTFQIAKRGTIHEGNYADLVIFDADEIIDTATFEQPRQAPKGIEYVLVNGRIVLDHGQILDGLHGELIK